MSRAACCYILRRMRHVTAFFLLLAAIGSTPADADDAALWRALAAGGHVAIMRHATAPGTGDPQTFAIGDCATQRNLSQQGRAEARAIGEKFRQNRVAVAKVFTSQWCRCRDTAAGMDVGPVVEDPRLNSFFGEDRATTLSAVSAAQAAVNQAPRSGPIAVYVTHQVNVTALTGVYPASGEIVVAKPTDAGVEVLGTIKP